MVKEHDRAIIAAEESHKECAHLRRQNARLEALTADLSHQVHRSKIVIAHSVAH